MTRFPAALAAVAVWAAPAWAGWFGNGIGSAMQYGPYTGGHGYSWNVAYSYGFAFSPADTWRRDFAANPAGYYPFRPYGWPIYYRVCPRPDTPYISVPGPDGLPVLVKPPVVAEDLHDGHGGPVAPPLLQPVPDGATPTLPPPVPVPEAAPAPRPVTAARIRVLVPADAEVWVEKEKMEQAGPERVFQTPPLGPGRMQIYSVRAKWHEAGREVEQFRVVGVKAGETAKLTFGAPAP